MEKGKRRGGRRKWKGKKEGGDDEFGVRPLPAQGVPEYGREREMREMREMSGRER